MALRFPFMPQSGVCIQWSLTTAAEKCQVLESRTQDVMKLHCGQNVKWLVIGAWKRHFKNKILLALGNATYRHDRIRLLSCLQDHVGTPERASRHVGQPA